jgi:hypothetical protein
MLGGFVLIMDGQAQCRPKNTDTTTVDAFVKLWGNRLPFKIGAPVRSGVPTFTISHYNSPVTHAADGFLERNLEVINPDFVSLLPGTDAGGEDSRLISPFVKSLFSTKALATQMDPRDEETIVSTQQPAKSMPTAGPSGASTARRSRASTRKATRPRRARTTTTRRTTATCRASWARCDATASRSRSSSPRASRVSSSIRCAPQWTLAKKIS